MVFPRWRNGNTESRQSDVSRHLLRDDGRAVVRQKQAFLHLILHRLPHARHVTRLRPITLLDGAARIALAIGLMYREGDVLSRQVAQVGIAEIDLARVPPGVGPERHSSLRRANRSE